MAETPTCPICQRAARPEVRPFCSTRCADIDLGRWFTESYRVPDHGAASESEHDEVG